MEAILTFVEAILRFVKAIFGLFDTFECWACGIDEKSQEHIQYCKVVRGMNKDDHEIPDYGKLFIGTVKDQLGICKLFKQNMKILENITQSC